MKLHADLTKRAVVFSYELPWVDSPMPGVQRRMLERDGDEVARAKGTFADEQGVYPKGTWLRNPSGSVHTPFSQEGCLIYVKTGHLDTLPQD